MVTRPGSSLITGTAAVMAVLLPGPRGLATGCNLAGGSGTAKASCTGTMTCIAMCARACYVHDLLCGRPLLHKLKRGNFWGINNHSYFTCWGCRRVRLWGEALTSTVAQVDDAVHKPPKVVKHLAALGVRAPPHLQQYGKRTRSNKLVRLEGLSSNKA
eukprot:1160146-Pelagomonas_calceolata.AAC.19